MKTREQLRKTALEKRSALKDRERLSQKICESVCALPEYISAKTVMGYMAINTEADISAVLFNAVQSNKTVLLPRVEGAAMRALEVKDFNDLERGAFNVCQPKSDAGEREPELVLVPLVCFDEKMNRLGYGKGYYDRFLSGRNVIKIGIAFSVQQAKEIEKQIFDIPLDKIVTENGIIEGRKTHGNG